MAIVARDVTVGGNGTYGTYAEGHAAHGPTFHGLVGQSRSMREVFSRIEKVAASDVNVCIYGESGTGKELVAQAIHRLSARRHARLVVLDCAAVPEGLMESHLFGHVRGAFTGAVDHREGVFALAHSGTLFVDELSELSLPMQAKLLRVIQSREFIKVGGTRPIRSDLRLVMATNRDLKLEMERGRFREDLYYRVAVVVIKLPPLRERREDIPLLAHHFVPRFSAMYQRPRLALDPALVDRIVDLPWPGNVRQLENFIEQAVVLAETDTLREADFDAYETSIREADEPASIQCGPWLPLDEVARRHIVQTLRKVQGNRTRAAKLLGISTRCLQYRLKGYAEEAGGRLPLKRVPSHSELAQAHLLRA